MLQQRSISGAGSVTKLDFFCRWINFQAGQDNSADVKIGGSDVSSSNGYPLHAGFGQMLPPLFQGNYVRGSIFVYVGSGDTLDMLYDDEN